MGRKSPKSISERSLLLIIRIIYTLFHFSFVPCSRPPLLVLGNPEDPNPTGEAPWPNNDDDPPKMEVEAVPGAEFPNSEEPEVGAAGLKFPNGEGSEAGAEGLEFLNSKGTEAGVEGLGFPNCEGPEGGATAPPDAEVIDVLKRSVVGVGAVVDGGAPLRVNVEAKGFGWGDGIVFGEALEGIED